MAREEALRFVRQCIGSRGPFSTPRAAWRKREQEIEQAPFNEVDDILDLLDDPGDLAEMYEPTDLQLAFADTLTRWGKRDPERMLDKIGARIHRPTARQVLLMVTAELGLPRSIEMLRPVWERVEQLSEGEQVDLVSALWLSRGAEAQRVLEQLARRIQPSHRDAQQEIQDALAWLASHTKPSKPIS